MRIHKRAVTYGVVVILILLSDIALSARVGDKSLSWPGQTLAGNSCYGNKQGQGPFDYADPREHVRTRADRRSKVETVEDFHFTEKVESLRGGLTGTDPYGDIAYTLRAYPNHHRALWAMSRYYIRRLEAGDEEELLRWERFGKDPIPPECYFNRALSFSPDDGLVHMVYGLYLHKRGMYELAAERYRAAEARLPKHAELAYNIGLLHVDLGDLTGAVEYASKAKRLGYPLRGLDMRIQRMREN